MEVFGEFLYRMVGLRSAGLARNTGAVYAVQGCRIHAQKIHCPSNSVAGWPDVIGDFRPSVSVDDVPADPGGGPPIDRGGGDLYKPARSLID